ncbi:MAG: hypothetical protein K2Q26_10640, partial [Bdellovibrionales bacterium]|nr:hypothetical protein [Bdellovibrionales bacterium]
MDGKIVLFKAGVRRFSWAKTISFQILTVLLSLISLELIGSVLLRFVPKLSVSALSHMYSSPPSPTAWGYSPSSPNPRSDWADRYQLIPSAKVEYSRGAYGTYRDLPFPILVHPGYVVKSKWDGTLIFKNEFTIDQFARRIYSRKSQETSKYLLFLGCSFTFGEGLADAETLPFATYQSLNNVAVYNYGISGASLGHLLFRMNVIEKSEILENEGWIVYPFLDQHISRLIGRLSVLGTGDFKKSLHFKFDDNDQLTTDGRFEDVWPLRVWIYQWLNRSHIVQFFGIDFPFRWSDEDFTFTTKILKQLQRQAEEKLNAKGLILVFLPGQKLSKELIPYLEHAKIRYLDYSRWDIKKLT